MSLVSDPFGLLAADAAAWTGLSVMAWACSGYGAYPAPGDGAHFGVRLTPEDSAQSSRDFTHFGFALNADGNGKLAVGDFGRC